MVPDIDDQVNHPEHLQEVNNLLAFLFCFGSFFFNIALVLQKVTSISTAKMHGSKQDNE